MRTIPLAASNCHDIFSSPDDSKAMSNTRPNGWWTSLKTGGSIADDSMVTCLLVPIRHRTHTHLALPQIRAVQILVCSRVVVSSLRYKLSVATEPSSLSSAVDTTIPIQRYTRTTPI